jgi:hypothetical protein
MSNYDTKNYLQLKTPSEGYEVWFNVYKMILYQNVVFSEGSDPQIIGCVLNVHEQD